MGERFRRFVEWGTSCKYVPLGTKCGVCGKKLGFFSTGFWSINAARVADGVLCARCRDRVIELLKRRDEWLDSGLPGAQACKRLSARYWYRLRTEQVTELFVLKEESDRRALGGNDGATALFRVVDVLTIRPGPLQVGVARSRRLNDRLVAYGIVDEGSFAKGEAVAIQGKSGMIETTVLEAYADDGVNSFEELARANGMRRRVDEDQRGWLILDVADGVAVGERIIKKRGA